MWILRVRRSSSLALVTRIFREGIAGDSPQHQFDGIDDTKLTGTGNHGPYIIAEDVNQPLTEAGQHQQHSIAAQTLNLPVACLHLIKIDIRVSAVRELHPGHGVIETAHADVGRLGSAVVLGERVLVFGLAGLIVYDTILRSKIQKW